ncbi:Fanconi anemia group I protein homolog isoform X2 [Vespa crabro]|uniref:Fanconi anemia group I protein homolog isoform X2 n=1 Tax=Vespa crabro TaxID=7445 RepID=UPI001EFFBC62|nr:Fanconi anemia group I protein homolog isoform X2 [Vespa crabro]XP_046836216.1 Fanconi anemia group I protein homolog isoform X2 [Vespa crabro]
MYAKLQDLMGRKDRPRLHKFVQNVNIEELCKVLSDKIYSADIVKVLDEILQAFCNADKFSENKLKVVKAILKTLGSAKINSNHAEEIISLIAMDFPNFSKNCLIQLVQFSTSNIYSNEDNFYSWKDLLPVLLEILEQEKYIDYMNSEVTGSEYKTLIVKSICNSHWEPSIVPCLAKMFGDMILEKKDLNVVIIALCHKLCMIALNEIPPFVYQTLRLCSNSSCIHLIVSLRKYFASYYSNANSKEKENNLDDISTTSLKEIQDAESNVLFHIHHATQLHYKCIKDLILAFKKFSIVPEYILEPFILSTIFIISSVHEEQVFEMLHQTILRKMQDDEKCKNSAWLNSLMNNNCDIMNIIDQVIANSDKDRHVVLKGIMELGFVLMDTEHTIGKVNKYPIHNIGIQILQRLMKKRHEICGSVLQLLTDKIVAGGLLISQYTDCLAYMCSKLAMNVLDFQTYIITLLDQLLCVPGTAAVQILYAVLPLIHVSSNIKDNLMLSLRKALYRKGICTRKMAVTGFLELLKMLKMNSRRNLSNDCSRNSSMSITLSNSTSILTQVTLEKHNNIGNNYGCNKRLCVDILNILKKCFTQEYEVRSHLYEGLYEVVIKNPELSEYIVEILLAQLNLYYEIDENVLPPLKIDLSADINDIQIVPKEPIATLISVLQAIYIKTALEDWEILNKVAIILESLCIRMIRTETEHLNLDDIMNLLDNTPKSQQKLHNLKEMIGVYESLISFRVNSWVNESKNIAKSIYGLFKGYNRLMDIIKNIRKKKGNKNKKNKDANNTTFKKQSHSDIIKLPNGNISLNIVCKILELHYLDKWSDNDEAKILRSHRDFYHYILQSCISTFQTIILLSIPDFEKHKKQYIKVYHKIGELLYKNVILEFRNAFNDDQQGTLLALQCFKEYCCLICSKFSSQLPQFIYSNEKPMESFNMQLETFILSFKAPLKISFEQDSDEPEFYKQMSLILLEIIQQFVHQLNFYEKNTKKIFEWISKCSQTEGISVSTAILILQILLWIEDCDKDNGEILNDICLEISEKLGMIHKIETSKNEKYKIINENTVVQAYSVLNHYIKNKLDNVSWFLERLKAELAIMNVVNINNEQHAEDLVEKERNLCRQLSYIIQILYTLANISIDPGQSTNSIFKNLQQLYNILSKLTKYFYNKSSSGNAAFHAVRFIQVIQLAGKPLKSTFYNLVTHIEESQSKDKKRLKTDTNIQKNHILKETKLIPRVVYEIEQFSKEVLLLAKKTGVPLENYIKHSVTRDFRILDSRLTESLEQIDVSMLSTQRTNVTNINNSLTHDLDNNSSSITEHSLTES